MENIERAVLFENQDYTKETDAMMREYRTLFLIKYKCAVEDIKRCKGLSIILNNKYALNDIDEMLEQLYYMNIDYDMKVDIISSLKKTRAYIEKALNYAMEDPVESHECLVNSLMCLAAARGKLNDASPLPFEFCL